MFGSQSSITFHHSNTTQTHFWNFFRKIRGLLTLNCNQYFTKKKKKKRQQQRTVVTNMAGKKNTFNSYCRLTFFVSPRKSACFFFFFNWTREGNRKINRSSIETQLPGMYANEALELIFPQAIWSQQTGWRGETLSPPPKKNQNKT